MSLHDKNINGLKLHTLDAIIQESNQYTDILSMIRNCVSAQLEESRTIQKWFWNALLPIEVRR